MIDCTFAAAELCLLITEKREGVKNSRYKEVGIYIGGREESVIVLADTEFMQEGWISIVKDLPFTSNYLTTLCIKNFSEGGFSKLPDISFLNSFYGQEVFFEMILIVEGGPFLGAYFTNNTFLSLVGEFSKKA